MIQMDSSIRLADSCDIRFANVIHMFSRYENAKMPSLPNKCDRHLDLTLTPRIKLSVIL